MEYLKWIEESGFSTWVRESPSILAFPTILLLHTISMACLVGISTGICVRILGFAPALRLSPLVKLFPVMWASIWVSAITGTILVMQDATTKMRNPDFYVKMVFIALAIITLKLVRTRVFGDPLMDTKAFSTNAKVLAVTLLVYWLGAITSGRLLAYVGPVAGL